MPTPSSPSPVSAPINRVGIVAKPGQAHVGQDVRQLAGWLRDRQVQAFVEAQTAELAGIETSIAAREDLPGLVDLVVVLGGDGTLLGMADCIAEAGLEVPLLGVNYGTLGFLTETALPELYAALGLVLAGHAEVDPRLMLRAAVIRDGNAMSTHVVLNDVAVTGGSFSRILECWAFVDHEFVAVFHADGIIVSSPTGSTAYNLSAGGPIIHPQVDAVILTPIAPHALTNRPIVIPAASHIVVQPILTRPSAEASVTFDGQRGVSLRRGDEIHVTRSPHSMRLLRAGTRSYYALLRKKLRWAER